MPAALLYTWAISHFDDEGLQEADPKYLKHEIVPYREDIPLETIKPLLIELVKSGLWRIYYTKDSAFIEDPVFYERQPMGGIHKIPSKIKPLIKGIMPSMFIDTPDGVRVHTPLCHQAQPSVPKRSEVKRSEEKRSEGETVSLDTGKTIETPFLRSDPASRKAILQQQAKQLGVTE